MQEIFGISAFGLALILSILLSFIGMIIAVLGSRRFVLVKMGVRNIPRRKTQSALIIIGLMLSTAIIATSLGIGDTVRYSIRSVALDSLGNIDEIIKGPGQIVFGEEYLGDEEFEEVRNFVNDDSRIDGIMPVLQVTLPVFNKETELAESRVRVTGYDPAFEKGFGNLYKLDGSKVSLQDLGSNDLFLNKDAAETLKGKQGDQIEVITVNDRRLFNLAAVVNNGGLARGGNGNPLALMRLDVFQDLLGKPNSITEIYISNKGDVLQGLDLSEEVTKDLRLNFLNKDVADDIFSLLQTSGIPKMLSEQAIELQELDTEISEKVSEISKILDGGEITDDFKGSIADYQLMLILVGLLDKEGFSDQSIDLLIRSTQLVELRIDDQKSDSVKLAETIGSGVTMIFSIFGSFSIMVGMLLIFLVFVLLAAARSVELGMARAVGLKRQHLIQLFTFEGTVYSLAAAFVGTFLGVSISLVLVFAVQDLVDTGDFQIKPYFTFKSGFIAFSSGLLLTIFTVFISAYRVSNLNIVVAIRGLQEEFVKKIPVPLKRRLLETLGALVLPVTLIISGLKRRDRKWWVNIVIGVGLLIALMINVLSFFYDFSVIISAVFRAVIVIWPIWVLVSIFKLLGKYSFYLFGVIGIGMIFFGIQSKQLALFSLGACGVILAFTFFLRKVFDRIFENRELSNQISGTLEGGLLLIFLMLPFDFFEPFTGELESGPELWPLNAAIQTGAAVWLLMSNSRILIWALNLILSPFSGIKAVGKVAIAYPMASKFRTGLTIAMFALIIFTLMIFSILNNIGDIASEEPDRVTGGYDVVATISKELPIADIQKEIDDSVQLNSDDFKVIASVSEIPVEAREVGAENKAFQTSRLVAVDNNFLNSNLFRLSHYDPSFGLDQNEIWKAVSEDTSLVILSYHVIPQENPFGPPHRDFKVESVKSGDPKEIESFEVELKIRRSSDEPVKFKVIGIVESLAESYDFGQRSLIYSHQSVRELISTTDFPFNKYYFQFNNVENSLELATKLETVFLDHSMEALDLENRMQRSASNSNAFNRLFQGFSSLGLVVGVAAVGVLTVRNVVERKQSIGVLRAIGFRSSMIRMQFLIESSFITILGVLVGIGLGTMQAWNIFLEITKELEGAKFVVPWVEVLFWIGIAVVSSIIASIIPANEASKIYPAEALRYE